MFSLILSGIWIRVHCEFLGENSATMTTETTPLDSLRHRVDRIDDQIHDLLMERVGLAGEIAQAKGTAEKDGVFFFRPGREAQILRRLMDRHTGPFPAPALMRIWREIFGVLSNAQQPLNVAVFQPERGAGYLELARNHFGTVSLHTGHLSAGHVVRLVADGHASVGVVPIPGDNVSDDPWWPSLTSDAGNLPRVIARLPGLPWQQSPGRSEVLEAFIIACQDHEPTGLDRTLVSVETTPDVSRDRLRTALAAGGLEPTTMYATHRSESRWLHLIEVEGYIHKNAPRLSELGAAKAPVQHARVLGGYPVLPI